MTTKKNLPRTEFLFFFSIYFIMFITGLAVLSTGAILPEIVTEFDISYDMAGVLLSLQAVGNMSALIISGYLSDIVGRKAVLLCGSLMIAVGFLGVAFTSVATALFGLIFISGCGWGINNIVSGILNDVTGGSTKHLNRLHMFFAVGAFTAPFFVIFAGALDMGWRTVFGTIGALAVCSVVLLIFIKIPMSIPKEPSHKNKSRVMFDAFKKPHYYIFLAIAFTYTAVETVMNGWITTYFQGTGILTNVQAKTVLSLIWISIMVGRITVSIVGDKIKKEQIIIICSALILVFSTVLIQLNSFIGVAICVVILGLGLSAVIPTNLANAAGVTSGSGVALGVLLASGGMGAAVGPIITGATAEYLSSSMASEFLGLSASMWVAVAFAAVLLLMAFINCILSKRAKSPASSTL